MSTYTVDELVDVTIRGARVHSMDPSGYLTVVYGGDGRLHYTAVRPTAETVDVDRIASADWPPTPGEVWRAGEPGEQTDYFVRTHNCQHEPPDTCFAEIELIDPDGAERPYPIERTLPAGLRPMVRVYPPASGGAR